MNILLTALHPAGCPKRPIGGVQSWAATMRDALTAMGHQVDVWGPYLPERKLGQFDAGLFAHWEHTHHLANHCQRVKRISHGIVPTKADLNQAIDAALARGSLRAHVETHHDSRKIAESLCQILA